MIEQNRGTLLAIAVKSQEDGNMHLLDEANITLTGGVANDPRGSANTNRQITVVSSESWADACTELGKELPWTLRRANLLVDGVSLPNTKGKKLVIGEVEMEITFETKPCPVMDEGEQGLMDALAANWRGGVLCKVLIEGRIRNGDIVELKGTSNNSFLPKNKDNKQDARHIFLP